MRRRPLLVLALLLSFTAAASRATDLPIRTLAPRPLAPAAGDGSANPRLPTAAVATATPRASTAATAADRRLEFPDVDLTADADGGGEVARGVASRSILPAALPWTTCAP
ncbi:MAG: hypothetical protein IPM94_11750 [bacterium]|nr:hypothetical protein [bacterium]